MRTILLSAFFWLTVLIFSAADVFSKSIILEAGEIYQDDDLQVMCVQKKQAQPIILKECQHWDDFNKLCLYEQKNHIFYDLECIEQCQHWDGFNKRCDYETKCIFHPAQGVFVLKTCEQFDDFSHSCIKSKEQTISKKHQIK